MGDSISSEQNTIKRLVFILLDGLGAATARRCMSYILALEEAEMARYNRLSAALPPLSRPIYALLLSGQEPATSGIFHNNNTLACPGTTVFQKAHLHGLTTAAASHSWISELCNRTPFAAERDRFTNDTTLPISHGLFYSSDAYPDDELFRDAEWLRQKFSPHLLFVHAMGIDYAGHRHGSDSPEYKNAVRAVDGLLARYLPLWLTAGYTALVTSDHGMDKEGKHLDITDEIRHIPLWILGTQRNFSLPAKQTEIAEMITTYLQLK